MAFSPHEPDQALSPSRHDQIDVLVHPQHCVHQHAVRVVDELDGRLGGPGAGEGTADEANQGGVGAQCLLAAPQNASVSRLEAQPEYINGHVGAALVDAGDHSQRNAAAGHRHPIGQGMHLNRFSDGVGKRRNLALLGGGPPETVRRQQQPVYHRFADPGRTRFLAVQGVGLQQLFRVGFQQFSQGVEGPVLDLGGQPCQLASGLARGPSVLHQVINGFGSHFAHYSWMEK